MGIGVAAFDDAGHVVASISKNLGHGTNNVAEHAAIEAALDLAMERGWVSVALFSDSQVAVRQVLGEYEVAAEHLKPIVRRNAGKLRALRASIAWVPREQNTEADALSKRAVQGSIFPMPADEVVLQVRRALAQVVGDVEIVGVMGFTLEHLTNEPERVSDMLLASKFGRSRWSGEPEDSARFSARLKHGDDAVAGMEAVLAARSPATRLKALRWAARGLAPALVCAKLAIEKVATQTYRQRNRGVEG